MNKIDTATLVYWADQLKQLHPQLPQGFIDYTLNQYNSNPKVFNEVVEEHKTNAMKPLPRDTQAEYNTTYCGNDIPWGESPQPSVGEIEQE